MFWIIGEGSAMTAAVKADIARLTGNEAMAGQLARTVYEHSRAQVQSVLAPAVDPGEPIFVLAHAGYADRPNAGYEPWIGGLWFDEFTTDMVTKFTVAGLSGRTLWFLVCHVGADITGFATRLAALGVRTTTIYMPTDFMYISVKGIPHVLPVQDDADAANELVQKYNCEFMTLTDSLDSGEGWSGVRIDSNGNVAGVAHAATKEAVLDRFDPDGDGEFV